GNLFQFPIRKLNHQPLLRATIVTADLSIEGQLCRIPKNIAIELRFELFSQAVLEAPLKFSVLRKGKLNIKAKRSFSLKQPLRDFLRRTASCNSEPVNCTPHNSVVERFIIFYGLATFREELRQRMIGIDSIQQ